MRFARNKKISNLKNPIQYTHFQRKDEKFCGCEIPKPTKPGSESNSEIESDSSTVQDTNSNNKDSNQDTSSNNDSVEIVTNSITEPISGLGSNSKPNSSNKPFNYYHFCLLRLCIDYNSFDCHHHHHY